MTGSLEGIPKAVWSMVRLASHRLLLVDYDGTLAPFRIARHEAFAVPRSLARLRVLAAGTHTSLAILSGRPIAELERFVGPLPAILVGENGWEHRLPGKPLVRQRMEPEVATVLDQAERVARDAGWSHDLERKRTALVLHTRRLSAPRAQDLEQRMRTAWLDLAARGGVEVEAIDGGVEIRARGHDTGTTVRWLMAQRREATLGAYVGDDEGDEPAFEVMRDLGFGIRVGESERPSHAVGRIPSCEAVGDFLDEWIRIAAG